MLCDYFAEIAGGVIFSYSEYTGMMSGVCDNDIGNRMILIKIKFIIVRQDVND